MLARNFQKLLGEELKLDFLNLRGGVACSLSLFLEVASSSIMRRQNSSGFHFSKEREPQNPFSNFNTRRTEIMNNTSPPKALPAQVIEPSTLARFNIMPMQPLTNKMDVSNLVNNNTNDEKPTQAQFECPICNNKFWFNDERSINQHVDVCLNTSSGILENQERPPADPFNAFQEDTQ